MTDADLDDFLLHVSKTPRGRAALLRRLCRVCSVPVDTLVGTARVSYVTFDDETVECLLHGRGK